MSEGPRFRIESVSEQTAAAVADLFYKVFGYTYTYTDLYDPAEILARERDGSYTVFVCTGRDGSVPGVLQLTYSLPSPRILEIGEILVDPELDASESGQVLKLMVHRLSHELRHVADNKGVRTILSLEVTEHRLTQRLSLEMGFMTGGIFLGYTPGWQRQLRATPRERDRAPAGFRTGPAADGRRSMVISVRPFRSKTPLQKFSVPTRFEDVIREIYVDYRLHHEIVPATRAVGSGTLTTEIDFRRERAIVEVQRVGKDTPDAVLRQLRHFNLGFIDLVQFVLPLSAVDLEPAVEALTTAGAKFAAVLPDYRDGPVLVMQIIDPALVAPLPQDVLSPRAARIAAGAM